MKIELINSDGILDTILPARFQKRNASNGITDSTKWSFVTEKTYSSHRLVYDVSYLDSNQSDDFRQGHDILMLEEFILFKQWPSYGKMVVILDSLKFINVNFHQLTANGSATLIIDFGPEPQKERPKLEFVFTEVLKADTEKWPVDLYLTNSDYRVSGLYAPDLVIDSCLELESIEILTSRSWTAIMSLDSADQLGNNHYNLTALATTTGDYFDYGPRRRIYRLWFTPKSGCLTAGDLVSLAWYNASVTDNAEPINEIRIDDFAFTAPVEPGDLYCPKYDVNLDSIVNLDDIILFLGYLAEINRLNSSQQCAADVDSNNQLNLADAKKMLRYINSPFGAYQIRPQHNRLYLAGAGALILKGRNLKVADLELGGQAFEFIEYSSFLNDTAFALKFAEDYRYYGYIEFNSTADIINGYQLTTGQPSTVEETNVGEAKPLKNKVSPNPFNNQCVVNYDLPYNSQVQITIYNQLGKLITTLVNDYKTKGQHQAIFSPDNNLAPGLYYYQIQTHNWSDLKIEAKNTKNVYINEITSPPYITGGIMLYIK